MRSFSPLGKSLGESLRNLLVKSCDAKGVSDQCRNWHEGCHKFGAVWPTYNHHFLRFLTATMAAPDFVSR